MSFLKKSPMLHATGTGAGSVTLQGKTTTVRTHKPTGSKGNVNLHGKTTAIRTK
jgi:hypothetical protein